MTCEACASGKHGFYCFDCKRCEARSYVNAPEPHQREDRRRWGSTLTPDEIIEMQTLVAEERQRT